MSATKVSDWLDYIEIPECFHGRIDRFNDWRRAIAELIGVQLSYGQSLRQCRSGGTVRIRRAMSESSFARSGSHTGEPH